MKLSHIISRNSVSEPPEYYTIRKHTPWIASPLQKVSTGSQTPPDHAEATKTPEGHHQGLHFPHQHPDDTPTFKHHHESSTIELFYDLFFVANLATFTANHEITDAKSLKNYIGFFTILWFTWLQTSLFDVRFATDSALNRLCKAVSFGGMTGFAITGAIYDTTDVGSNLKAFRALAIILMVSRLALVAQYGVVLYYVKEYRRTHVPMMATMATLLIAAFIYLGTFWGFKEGLAGDSFPIQHDGEYTYVAYYVVAVVEAFSIIIISCIWRIVSFKHTHLVERIGLLTLIIMGEGIIGMTKSVSKIIQNSSAISSRDIGIIISAVLLIYFIWVLYFDQIENDRFGTIRQQIWALLHFPLHVGILLTVEGSTALIIWNIICQIDNKWWSFENAFLPTDENYNYNFTQFDSAEAVVKYMNDSIATISTYLKPNYLTYYTEYNITEGLDKLGEIEAKFNSDEYVVNATEYVYEIFIGVENAFFSTFGIEPPEREDSHSSSSSSDNSTGISAEAQESQTQNDALYDIFITVYEYFPIAAGVFLIILAILFWFGKTKKTRGEWGSIGVRAFFGVGLTLAALAPYYGPYTSSDGYFFGPWAIPLVMLTFFVVIVLDNVLVWWWNKSVARRGSAGGVGGGEGVFGRKEGHARGDSSEGSAA